jgi:hypothetical protein
MCPTCQYPASSVELKAAGPDKVLACGKCRKPKSVDAPPTVRPDKYLFSFNVAEVEDGEGKKDYLIEVNLRSEVLSFHFEATVDQIRKHLAEQRKKEQQLMAVE